MTDTAPAQDSQGWDSQGWDSQNLAATSSSQFGLGDQNASQDIGQSTIRKPIQIVSVFPSLLGTYGDGGNVLALRHIAKLHGIATEVIEVNPGDVVPTTGDLYIMGGGEDTAQVAAAQGLRKDGNLAAAAADGAAVLAICAGYQLLGHEFPDATGAPAPGLGILDITTTRLPQRAVGELLAYPTSNYAGKPLLTEPLTGYENHAGATRVGSNSQPLASVDHGVGNGDRTEGATLNHTIGTYLHGPCLARNPELAELLIGWATGQAIEPIREPEVQELRKVRLAVAASYEKTAQTSR